MSDKNIIHQITLSGDETLTKIKQRRPKEPNYYRIGNGTMNKHGIQARDFISELVDLSKPAQTVIKWIKEGMLFDSHENGITFIVKVVPDTVAGKSVLKKGLPELFEKDLVRRVKRGYYMISPYALITDFEKQIEEWEKAKK